MFKYSYVAPTERCPKKCCVFALCFVSALVGIMTFFNYYDVIIDIKSKQSDIQTDDRQCSESSVVIDGTSTLQNVLKLKLVNRSEWLALPSSSPPNSLRTPVPYVIILHTATRNCTSEEDCIFHVRFIQTYHMETRNWVDIGYNFLVGGDGSVYEGRGWGAEGAHTFGYNAKSLGIAFIGTFSTFKPPWPQVHACKQLIAKGVAMGYISEMYKLLGARQVRSTESPGDALFEDIKKWKHWSVTP